MSDNLLEFENVKISFATQRGEIPAVRGVSAVIPCSKTLGVVGESGSGKSALALSVMRLHNTRHTIYDGKILFEGRNVFDFSSKELLSFRGAGAGIIFQEPMNSLNPVMKVGEQIAEVLYAHKKKKLSKKEIMERARVRLEEVGIDEAKQRMDVYPHQLSGGMRQRVMIAAATVLHPKLLIADEPTTSLDVTVQRKIMNLLLRIKKESGTSMMLISHDFGIISDIADYIAVMYLGRVVEYGKSQSILDSPKHPYSRALIEAARTFENGSTTGRLNSIKGSVPSPNDAPKGCAFHPRCPKVMDECRVKEPQSIPIDGQSVRCHLYS